MEGWQTVTHPPPALDQLAQQEVDASPFVWWMVGAGLWIVVLWVWNSRRKL